MSASKYALSAAQRRMMKPNIKDLSFKEFEAYLSELQQPAYRARQIWQWLFRKAGDFFCGDDKSIRIVARTVGERFSIGRLKNLAPSGIGDGTVKFLFGLNGWAKHRERSDPGNQALTFVFRPRPAAAWAVHFAPPPVGSQTKFESSEILSIRSSRQRERSTRAANHAHCAHGNGRAAGQLSTASPSAGDHDRCRLGSGYRPTSDPFDGRLVPQIDKLMEETQVNLAISLHAAQ